MIKFQKAFFLTYLFFGLVSCGDSDFDGVSDAKNSVFIYSGGYSRGDVGYATLKNLCVEAYNKLNFDFEKKNTAPFLSSSERGDIRDLLPQNSGYIIRSSLNNNLRIQETWEELWDQNVPLINPISEESHFWFSGSSISGDRLNNASCGAGEWSNLNNSSGGAVGQTNITDTRWINYFSKSCESSQLILCLAY